MARVTDSEVKEIYVTTSDTTPFITTATLLVDEELVGLGYSSNRLKQIELYLAAHFAVISLEKGGLRSRKIDEAEDEYKPIEAAAKGFMSTRFGQQALSLDNEGKLANLSSNPVKARFRVI